MLNTSSITGNKKSHSFNVMNPVIPKSLLSLEQGKVPGMEIFPRKIGFSVCRDGDQPLLEGRPHLKRGQGHS